MIADRFKEHNVKIYGCERTRAILGDSVEPATDTEYATEFNDYIIAVKVVDTIDEAIAHKTFQYPSLECIVTLTGSSREVQKEVDAAEFT